MRKSEVIHTAVDKVTKQELVKFAKAVGVSTSTVIRVAIERYLLDRGQR